MNGAGKYGCMGGLNDGCLDAGGYVIGVIHRKFCVDFGEHRGIQKLIIVDGADLSERKYRLLDNSDSVIVMPGGVGTFEELWDAVSAKSLDMSDMVSKPICLVNINGYYDGFIQQLDRASREGLLFGPKESYFHITATTEAALDYVASHRILDFEHEDLRRVDRMPQLPVPMQMSDYLKFIQPVAFITIGVVMGINLQKYLKM